jgi:hypothetical protein
MKDLTSAFWIKLKGLLFLVIGVAAAVLLWLEIPTTKTAVLIMVAVWGFCRFYYFAFYVIEKYVDPSHKFSGLVAFAQYLLRRKQRKQQECVKKTGNQGSDGP